MRDTCGEYHLANGEVVISNLHGQADKYRPILDAINRGEYPKVNGGAS